MDKKTFLTIAAIGVGAYLLLKRGSGFTDPYGKLAGLGEDVIPPYMPPYMLPGYMGPQGPSAYYPGYPGYPAYGTPYGNSSPPGMVWEYGQLVQASPYNPNIPYNPTVTPNYSTGFQYGYTPYPNYYGGAGYGSGSGVDYGSAYNGQGPGMMGVDDYGNPAAVMFDTDGKPARA